jgi:hypothetical protein
MPRLRDNILWGIRSAVFYSKFYSGLALFVYIVGGGIGFAKAGLKFGPVLAFYLVAPLLAGAVVGALRPLSGNVVGQMLIGAVAAIPVALGVYLVVLPAPLWHERLFPLVAFSALVFGPIMGAVTYLVDKETQRSD